MGFCNNSVGNMIRIYTFAHKRPDFLGMQLKSFQKNLENEYEFIVFNNAAFDPVKNHYNEIQAWCAANRIQCIDVKKDQELIGRLHAYDKENLFNGDGQYANASIACAYPLCWAWEQYISRTDDKICIIDSDMFVMEKTNIETTLDEYDMVYMPQSRGNGVYYMWNGISFMNLGKMPEKETLNWWCGHVEGQPVDVGGRTFYYLRKHKDNLKTKEFNLHYVGEDPDCNFSPANYEYFTTTEDRTLLHYRGGSNWDQKTPDYHTKKTSWLLRKLG